MGWKNFSLIFIASLIGVTGNQMIQYEGIYLASSPATSALSASIIRLWLRNPIVGRASLCNKKNESTHLLMQLDGQCFLQCLTTTELSETVDKYE
ncbi:hypothetical protein Tco_1415025, partial [Tanacetum coccineum]